MTKQKRAITINTELDAAIGMLAIRHKMSYSGFVESRLLEHKEISKEIERQRELPEEPPAMLRGDIRETLKHSPHDVKKVSEIAAE